MLYIFFTLFIFTRNQQIIKVKQKDHISSMSSVGLVFFLARACQHKTSKIRITSFTLLQLKLCILQDRNKFKSTYLAQFNSLINIPQTVGFIFLSNSTLIMNPTKFRSPHLDTPNSRYKFLKFAFKYVKINKENQFQIELSCQVHLVQCTHCD